MINTISLKEYKQSVTPYYKLLEDNKNDELLEVVKVEEVAVVADRPVTITVHKVPTVYIGEGSQVYEATEQQRRQYAIEALFTQYPLDIPFTPLNISCEYDIPEAYASDYELTCPGQEAIVPYINLFTLRSPAVPDGSMDIRTPLPSCFMGLAEMVTDDQKVGVRIGEYPPCFTANPGKSSMVNSYWSCTEVGVLENGVGSYLLGPNLRGQCTVFNPTHSISIALYTSYEDSDEII